MIVAAADGSSLNNPGPAGWAWYIDDDTWLPAAGHAVRITWASSRLFSTCCAPLVTPTSH